jgi:hypothetical protein
MGHPKFKVKGRATRPEISSTEYIRKGLPPADTLLQLIGSKNPEYKELSASPAA